MYSIEKQIFDYLFHHIDSKRFEHSVNVANLAVKLAKIYSVDMFNAQIAGLLHDCAKYITIDDLHILIKKNNIKNLNKELTLTFDYIPNLIHSFAGAIIASSKFKIQNSDILNAIKNHTQGRINMSYLEKIIFVSDFLSYERKFKDIFLLRKLAKKNLNTCFLFILKIKLQNVIKKNLYLSKQTMDTWNWYIVSEKK